MIINIKYLQLLLPTWSCQYCITIYFTELTRIHIKIVILWLCIPLYLLYQLPTTKIPQLQLITCSIWPSQYLTISCYIYEYLKSKLSPDKFGPNIVPTHLWSLKSHIKRFPSHPADNRILGVSSKNFKANTLLTCPG